MTYKIKILRLDGSVFERDISYAFDFLTMKGYYINPEVINTKFLSVTYAKFSGDIEEVTYQEVKLEK
jgi:hypothetical protein